jgi:ABC-2 type transport system permease protein
VSATFLIMRRELGAYFRSMTGYIIAAAVLLVDGVLFNAFVLGAGERRSGEVLAQFFWVSSGTTMIASIFLSMRLLAEERQTGTIMLLTSSPIRDRDIVMGKFLSGFIFLALITLATGFLPALIMVHGKISLAHVLTGYLGLLLLGGSTMAIGTFGSALAKSQVLAVIISGALVVLMILAWMIARVTEHPLNRVFEAVALYHRHFPPFQVGIIHLRDVVYYLALIYFALFAATRVLEARRWR